jgi:hypothetical protein
MPKKVREVKGENAKSAYEWAVDQAAEKKDWTDEQMLELVNRMNKEYALAVAGSGVVYVAFGRNDAGMETLDFRSKTGMQQQFANTIIDGSIKNPTTAFDHWLAHPGRRTYPSGVVFKPAPYGQTPEVRPGQLNLWRGFALEPKEGDWGLYREHIHSVICGGNEAEFAWFMDWLAFLVQSPHKKPGSALVLRSEDKGTGKSTLKKCMAKIFGRHAVSVTNKDQVVGKFNSVLQDARFVAIEESFFAGAKSEQSTMNNLITEERIIIEKKGVDPVELDSFAGFLILANRSWVVPVGRDERRYGVYEFTFPMTQAEKKPYWDAIYQQLENGGYEAMFHELLHRKITSNLYAPPKTKGLMAQRELSQEGVERFLHVLASEGGISIGEGDYFSISTTQRSTVRADRLRKAAEKHCDQYEGRSLQTHLGMWFHKVGVTRRDVRSKINGKSADIAHYDFPPLPEFVANVEAVLDVKFEHAGIPVDGHTGFSGEDVPMQRVKGGLIVDDPKRRPRRRKRKSPPGVLKINLKTVAVKMRQRKHAVH